MSNATLQDVLAEYEPIVERLAGHADGPETDFVMRRDDYRILRDAALSARSASELPKQERHCSMCLRNTSRWPCNATHCPLRDNGPAASERALGHDQHSGSSCAAERMDANEGSTPSGSALCTRSATLPPDVLAVLQQCARYMDAMVTRFVTHKEYKDCFAALNLVLAEHGHAANSGSKNG